MQVFDPLQLHGKRFLITGAASGIGRATAVLLSQLGAGLILLDVNLAGLNETKALCNDTGVFVEEADLQDTNGIKGLVTQLCAKYGVINGLAHIAGIPCIVPLKALTESKYLDVMRINTFAGLELAKAFINRQVNAGDGGSVVFISSIYALAGSAGSAGYAMSKAALHGITKALAIEFAPKKIRVNCIAPGFINTKMKVETAALFDDDGRDDMLNKLHPLGLGEPEDVANACAFLLSDMGRWITGSIMSVDGGYTAQ